MSHSNSTSIPEDKKSENSDYQVIPKNLKSWWEEPYEVERSLSIYTKEKACLDPVYLEDFFKDIDKRIYRRVRDRMKPGLAKNVKPNHKMGVAFLTVPQFFLYLERLSSSVKGSRIYKSSIYHPSLDCHHRLKDCVRKVFWKNGKFPHLSHKHDWAFIKWVDTDAKQIHRAYAINFGIVHNGHTGNLSVTIDYGVEFYNEAYKKWVKMD